MFIQLLSVKEGTRPNQLFDYNSSLPEKQEQMEPPPDQHLKTTNNGQMDKVVKEETDDPNGESGQPPDVHTAAKPCVKLETSGWTPPLVQSPEGSAPVPHGSLNKWEEEPHETHTFVWCWGTSSRTITCNKARTVENSLMTTSPRFREIVGKNKKKELVIVRDGKAISSHCPCSLIGKDEKLTIKYVKAVNKPKQIVTGSDRCQRKGPPSELVMFHLMTTGGENLQTKIMINLALNKCIDEITVYAYKGETVKQALKRDGRLGNELFTKNCELSNKSTEVTTEMSSLVDDLDGKTFKIILLNRDRPPDSQPSSLEDAPLEQSSTTESVNVNTPKKTVVLDGKGAPDSHLCEKTHSKMMQSYLNSQFQDFMESKEISVSGLTPIKHLRVEYGKNVQRCKEVKTMKQLGELSNSVCSVRVNGKPKGSGFHLFDKFVLTNGHVVENVYDASTLQLTEKLTVHFSYESVGQVDSGVEVEEVVGLEYAHDASGHKHDWALLRISADQNVPDVLLKQIGLCPKSGGICIIGHPGDSPKMADPCFIVPTEERSEIVERHRRENPEGVLPFNEAVQLITHRFFDEVKHDKQNRQALHYETCLDFGSSGSPVFDEHCNVVAMHSGGYPYTNTTGKQQSVVEFGYAASIIIERIVAVMVLKNKFAVLKEYLACDYKHQQHVHNNVKKLLESINFRFTAATETIVTGDESLRKFFEFLSREDPVQMDVDVVSQIQS
ncbi:Protein FAM111A [Liparis tanakae]|uniref:Protein FAM111A n=1 Tax=Liparis tanakae TaxID=230148 RepID=A0A4Z2HLP1_9TELE|nr:Protein FAM111A [Liparis tanakae]